MMKRIEALVSGAVNGQKFENDRWTFTMLPPDAHDEGNGRYIQAYCHDDGTVTLIDIRYSHTDLVEHVETYLRTRYGDTMNAVQYSMEYEEE